MNKINNEDINKIAKLFKEECTKEDVAKLYSDPEKTNRIDQVLNDNKKDFLNYIGENSERVQNIDTVKVVFFIGLIVSSCALVQSVVLPIFNLLMNPVMLGVAQTIFPISLLGTVFCQGVKHHYVSKKYNEVLASIDKYKKELVVEPKKQEMLKKERNITEKELFQQILSDIKILENNYKDELFQDRWELIMLAKEITGNFGINKEVSFDELEETKKAEYVKKVSSIEQHIYMSNLKTWDNQEQHAEIHLESDKSFSLTRSKNHR